MRHIKKFYRFFKRHRLKYALGLAALFVLLGWFARTIVTGWWVVAIFYTCLLPYVIYLIGCRCNWDAEE